MSILKISILFAPELNPATSSRREFGRGPGWAIPGFVKLPGDPFKTKYLSSRLCFAITANGGGFRKELKGVGVGVGVGGGDAVIIDDHGSRRNESNLMLRWDGLGGGRWVGGRREKDQDMAGDAGGGLRVEREVGEVKWGNSGSGGG
ncbi:UNVERIFIED_CONTAM: hypothetical protein Sangu_1289500 [Sesamum angustifolium]|uniref:Uncharacterized protein n=1 Tax=Sesamum angustifolium TaxID=2727405 RepID=A0AAW2NN71_9LAMI